ncbi:MAG: protease inhibitor I42 family protein [Chloroflexi bacterium]|nr:protease inhibitor I42 family protein [Chloroflexota bacterium]
MKKILLLVCVVIFMVPFLSGCGKPVIIRVGYDEFMEQKNVSRQIEIWPAYAITVFLYSNPSTGFSWSESADISDQSVVQQYYHGFIAPKESVPGAPGEERWQFKAIAKGTSTIKMLYSRPGEDKPEWTFTLNVTVKPAFPISN